MAQPRVSIRLGTDGKAQVQRDFADIADAGDATAKRLKAAFERDAAAAERAFDKVNKTAARLAAVGSPAAAPGADISAKVLERQEAATRRLLAAVDPLFAAQERYSNQLQKLNSLKAQGALTEERYQQLLAAEKVQLDQVTLAQQRNARTSGQMRMGMQQLGFQLGDISTQFAMGTRAATIFAQQSGQVIQAFQLMGGQGNKFLQFLSGPWGIALSVGAIALTPLIAKLFEAKDGVGALVDKMKEQARQAELNEKAGELWKNSLEGVEQGIRAGEKALKDHNDQSKTFAQRELEKQFAYLKTAQAIREQNLALLENAKAQFAAAKAYASGPKGDVAALGLVEHSERISDIEGKIARANAALAAVNVQINEFTRLRLSELMGTGLDPKEWGRPARDSRAPPAADRSSGAAIQSAQIAAMFDEAARWRGTTEKSATLEQFLTQALGKPLDPEKTAWCAAFVNAVLATQGVKGTGSLAARSFLGFGKDDTSSPQKGDIVIVRSGGSPSGQHVGFLDSIDAKGNFRVLGGNTANAVATGVYAPKDVLGIRRPPTAGEQMASVQKAADAAAEAASAEATRQFIDSLKAQTKIDLAGIAEGFEQRKKALGFLEGFDREHQERMTLLKTELSLAGESEQHRARSLDLLRQELDIRRQYPALEEEMVKQTLARMEAEDALRAKVEQVLSSVQEFKQIGENALDTIFNPQTWDDWGEAGKRILKELEADLIRLALLNPLKNLLFGSNLPTLFGAFAGLLGGGGGGGAPMFTPANPGVGYAVGTEYFPGGLTWVGENGKELVRLPRGSRITPAGESRRLAAANDGMGPIVINQNIDARGADSAGLARLQFEIAQMKNDLPGMIVSTWLDARARNVIR